MAYDLLRPGPFLLIKCSPIRNFLVLRCTPDTFLQGSQSLSGMLRSEMQGFFTDLMVTDLYLCGEKIRGTIQSAIGARHAL
jgi:hypothetical protein